MILLKILLKMIKFCLKMARNALASIGLLVILWVCFIDKDGKTSISKSWDNLKDLGASINLKQSINESNVLKAESVNEPLVILDPGHGGEDGGTAVDDVLEKDLNLLLAQEIAKSLKAHNVSVMLTRDSDKLVSLKDRAHLVNQYPNTIFISIHHNAVEHQSAKGVETFFSESKTKRAQEMQRISLGIADQESFIDNRSKILAQIIHSSACRYTQSSDRGIHDRGFAMTRWISGPAALIECGFLTNEEERKKLLSASYRELLSKGIVEAVLGYLAEVSKDSYYGIVFEKAPRAIVDL